MTFSLPPKYIPLPIEILEEAYKPDKPHQDLFLSFVRLLALAWQNKYEHTPKLREDEMYNTKNPDGTTRSGYLKVSRREYFTRKREMELVGWLRSSHPATGFVQFSFSRAIALVQDGGAETRIDVHDVRENAPSELIGGGESLNLNLNTDSPPPIKSNSSAGICTIPSVVEILRHTDKLFGGSVVHAKGLEACSPLEALAWCAYAYFNKGKLDAPGGLVRARLLAGEDAPLWTTEQWPEVLPKDFLEALGLVTYVCDVCQAKFKKQAEFEAHELTHPSVVVPEEVAVSMETDESVMVPIHGSMNAQRAWETVLGQLQMDMPRASFDTWVKRSMAVRFHGNVLSVGVQNALARDWLESRIRSTVVRLLVGILARHVDVAFVVAAGETDHE